MLHVVATLLDKTTPPLRGERTYRDIGTPSGQGVKYRDCPNEIGTVGNLIILSALMNLFLVSEKHEYNPRCLNSTFYYATPTNNVTNMSVYWADGRKVVMCDAMQIHIIISSHESIPFF